LTKSILTEYRYELSGLLCVVFAIVTVIGLIGAFLESSLPSYLSFLADLSQPFGDWAYWFVIAGPIGLVACAWWLYDYLKKTRELSKLIDTPSKAKFVRNLDDIEYLAWNLPQRFEDKVLAKKKEFGL
jgi:H+/Cl- antiporter ClcA